MFRSFLDWLFIEKFALTEAIEHELLVKTEDSAVPLANLSGSTNIYWISTSLLTDMMLFGYDVLS